MNKAINLGSGDQHFNSTKEIEWINMDLDDRDGKVEVKGDVSKKLPFEDETFDIMVASHIVEHVEMSIVPKMLTDWIRCLKKGGNLIITVPNARELAEKYVTKDISHFIFAINMTGPYHGSNADHHAWCYDYEELLRQISLVPIKNLDVNVLTSEKLTELGINSKVALDWWILGIIITKK